MKRNPTINFCYFTGNFPSDFINQVWKGETLLADHLNSKFTSIMNRENLGYASYNVFMKWFFELDEENKTKLVNWVNENYNSQLDLEQSVKKPSLKVISIHEFSDEDINDLMTTAFEGGINYWCNKVTAKENPGVDANCYVSDYISRGGTLILYDAESANKWELDLEMLMNGIKMFCENNNLNPAALINNHDACDADCIIQYALFKEQVFA
jgi:hypothetical protein